MNHALRLIVRYPMHADVIGTFVIFEPAHFVMESGMMLGIKQRAERSKFWFAIPALIFVSAGGAAGRELERVQKGG